MQHGSCMGLRKKGYRGSLWCCNYNGWQWPSVSGGVSASGCCPIQNTNATISVTRQQEVGCPWGGAREWSWIHRSDTDELKWVLSGGSCCLPRPERKAGAVGHCGGLHWPTWLQGGWGSKGHVKAERCRVIIGYPSDTWQKSHPKCPCWSWPWLCIQNM